MALDQKFLTVAERLRLPGMGTEHVAWLLYSLVRMTRPAVVLEVGAGYTTLFLLRAIADNLDEIAADREVVTGRRDDEQRRGLLVPERVMRPYTPLVVAVDDLSVQPSGAAEVVLAAKELGIDGHLTFIEGDIRSVTSSDLAAYPPIDLAWVDAGGPRDDAEFLRRFWRHINPRHGMVIFHDGYWTVPVSLADCDGRAVRTIPGSITNEAKRQLVTAGAAASFEVLSLLEPHKYRQNGIVALRRIPPLDHIRDVDFTAETAAILRDSGCKPFTLGDTR